MAKYKFYIFILFTWWVLVAQAIAQTVISDSVENWYKYRVSSIYCYGGWELPSEVMNYIGLCGIPFDSIFAHVFMVSTDSGCFPILPLKKQFVWLGFRYIDGKNNCNYYLCVKQYDTLVIEAVSRIGDTVCINDTCKQVPFIYKYIKTDPAETLLHICSGANDVIINLYGSAIYYEARAYPFFYVHRDNVYLPITESWLEWIKGLLDADTLKIMTFLDIYLTGKIGAASILPDEYAYALIYSDSILYGYGPERCPVPTDCYVDFGYVFRWGANNYLHGFLPYFDPYREDKDSIMVEGVYLITTRRKTNGSNNFLKGYLHPLIPWSFYH